MVLCGGYTIERKSSAPLPPIQTGENMPKQDVNHGIRPHAFGLLTRPPTKTRSLYINAFHNTLRTPSRRSLRSCMPLMALSGIFDLLLPDPIAYQTINEVSLPPLLNLPSMC